MRADLVGLGLAITLLSTSLAHGQVVIDVSKVTCDQFAQGKIGEPRTLILGCLAKRLLSWQDW